VTFGLDLLVFRFVVFFFLVALDVVLAIFVSSPLDSDTQRIRLKNGREPPQTLELQ
jgi:hypothetical protein